MSDIAKRLNATERNVLKAVDERQTVDTISEKTELSRIAVIRSGTYLAEESLFTQDEATQTTYKVTDKGRRYVGEGLPELQVYNALGEKGKAVSDLTDIFDKNEVNASIGRLKKMNAVKTEHDGDDLHLVPTDSDPTENYALQAALENPEGAEQPILEELQSRGLITDEETKTVSFERTKHGDDVASQIDDLSIQDTITTAVLEQETWKGKQFREYRVTDDVQEATTGRKHFVKEAIDDIKDFWVSLGFEEMRGDHVQSAFWDLDALFVPQDHPARDLQDTFYLDKKSSIPDDYFNALKAIHEDGGNTSSDGWQTPFTKQTSQETLLRTHTTVLSAKQFASLTEDDLPKKYFSVDKTYRNETIDWSHLMEFHQVEGIVVTEKASLARLISYLDEFFGAMGYDDVRVRPAFFPYTEPSAEVDAYNEAKDEWVEIGGAGVIRPEVTKPLLGFKCPVLAWGTGLERIITAYYNIDDLRHIYNNDIKDLQQRKRFTYA